MARGIDNFYTVHGLFSAWVAHEISFFIFVDNYCSSSVGNFVIKVLYVQSLNISYQVLLDLDSLSQIYVSIFRDDGGGGEKRTFLAR